MPDDSPCDAKCSIKGLCRACFSVLGGAPGVSRRLEQATADLWKSVVALEKAMRLLDGIKAENEGLRVTRDRLIVRAKFAEDDAATLRLTVKAAQNVIDRYEISSRYTMDHNPREIEQAIWDLKNVMLKSLLLRVPKEGQ